MKNTAKCANCGKPISRPDSGGTWLHRWSASSSCWPGGGSWKRATPQEVEAA